MAKDLFRRELADFKAYVAGKPIEQVRREYGLESIEKLASNENQIGPSPKAVEAIREAADGINFYPEASCYDLAHDLAAHHKVDFENIVVGNGGEGLIWNIAMTFLNAGDEIITAFPSFDIYKISGDLMGAKTIRVPFKGKEFDIKGFVDSVNENTKLIYLCSPNNPTGNIASADQIRYLIDNIPQDVVLIMDEAYYDFAAAHPDYPANSIDLISERPNTIVLRSFSKIYGLAGVRIGYLVTSKELATEINKVKQTLGVNLLGQVGARAALKDEEYRKLSVEANAESIRFFEKYFDDRGFDYFKSYSNFIWADIKTDSRDVFVELQKKGIIIRAGFLWGWDTWIRVNTGTPRQMQLFAEKMDEVLGI